jgi:hypothetical protein
LIMCQLLLPDRRRCLQPPQAESPPPPPMLLLPPRSKNPLVYFMCIYYCSCQRSVSLLQMKLRKAHVGPKTPRLNRRQIEQRTSNGCAMQATASHAPIFSLLRGGGQRKVYQEVSSKCPPPHLPPQPQPFGEAEAGAASLHTQQHHTKAWHHRRPVYTSSARKWPVTFGIPQKSLKKSFREP